MTTLGKERKPWTSKFDIPKVAVYQVAMYQVAVEKILMEFE